MEEYRIPLEWQQGYVSPENRNGKVNYAPGWLEEGRIPRPYKLTEKDRQCSIERFYYISCADDRWLALSKMFNEAGLTGGDDGTRDPPNR